jgi:hypothetical protein
MLFKKIKYIFLIIILFLFGNCAAFFIDTPEFKVYETKHYVFYYLENSKVEKDIIKIGEESEKAIEWAGVTMGIDINLKMDSYFFDDGTSTCFYRLIKSLKKDSTVEISSGFHICYDRGNYDPKEISYTVLHESVHVVQIHLNNLVNYGIREGHALYIELKYMFYCKSLYYDELYILMQINNYAEAGIEDGDFPHKIFNMTGSEFQNVDYTTITRDPGYRYYVGASFISYLVDKYGMNKLHEWFYLTNQTNFEEKFRSTYNVDFITEENEWLKKYIY